MRKNIAQHPCYKLVFGAPPIRRRGARLIDKLSVFVTAQECALVISKEALNVVGDRAAAWVRARLKSDGTWLIVEHYATDWRTTSARRIAFKS